MRAGYCVNLILTDCPFLFIVEKAANFLDIMAKTIDFSVAPSPEKSKARLYGEELMNGDIHKSPRASSFHPMNRKLAMTISNWPDGRIAWRRKRYELDELRLCLSTDILEKNLSERLTTQ